jgi:hypothetical protein
MDSFVRQQQLLQDQMEQILQMAPSSVLKEMAERNMELWRSMQENLLQTFVSSSGGRKPDGK